MALVKGISSVSRKIVISYFFEESLKEIALYDDIVILFFIVSA